MARFVKRFFSSRKWSSSEPKDIFSEPFAVYNVPEQTLASYTTINGHRGLVLMVGTKHFRSSGSQRKNSAHSCFELWFCKNIPYSFFRTKKLNEAHVLFNLVCDPLADLEMCIKEEDIFEDSLLIQQIVQLIRINPSWTTAHLSSKLDLADLFSVRNDFIIKSLNKRVGPEQLTPLHVAIIFNNSKVVNAIFALHHTKSSRVQLGLTDSDGNNLLHLGSVSSVEMLTNILRYLFSLPDMERLTFLRSLNVLELNPFQMACLEDKVDNVKLFLKFGVPVDIMVMGGGPGGGGHRTQDRKVKESKKRDITKTVIVKLKAEHLEDLDESQVKLGGTPIHWIMSRKFLEQLVQLGIPVRVRNRNGETPLHVFVRKQRLRNYLYLLCTNDEHRLINARDANGNTALHLAVLEGDTVAVQALLVFGIDHAICNHKDETARHLAASDPHEISCRILSILHLVGAGRCKDSAHSLCCDGCASDGTYNGTPLDSWPQFDALLLNDALSATTIEEARSRKVHKNGAKVICFDGGGVKGVFSVQVLIELEQYLQKPIHKYFTWISGTSAGSVISALLSLGAPLTHLRRQVILHFKDKIMGHSTSKPNYYNGIQKFLEEGIGSKVRMYEVKLAKLLIFTCLADRSPFRLHVFRNFPSAEEILGHSKPKHRENVKIWKACLASGMIPLQDNNITHSDSKYLDGGFVANNPTLDTLTEVTRYNLALEVTQNLDLVEPLSLVVSIGSGIEPSKSFHVPRYRFNKIAEYTEFAEMFIQQMTNTNAHVVKRSESWCNSLKVPFFRLNPPFDKYLSAFETDDEKIIHGLWLTKAYMYAVRPQLRDLVELLEK